MNQKLFKPKLVPAAVPDGLSGTETDGRHGHHTGESSSEGGVDTSGFPPAGGDSVVSGMVVPDEFLVAFFGVGFVVESSLGHFWGKVFLDLGLL